jgi:hypothetical protein
MPLDLYITTNSPGEIAGWLAPLSAALRDRAVSCRTTVVVTPCPFASGSEYRVLSESGLAARVTSIWQALRTSRSPGRAQAGRDSSLVVFLGGDETYALLLARRLGTQAWAYSARPRWRQGFARVFVPNEDARVRAVAGGLDPARIEAVGQLAVDSVRHAPPRSKARETLGLEGPVMLLLPGSRPQNALYVMPLLADAADLIHAEHPEVQFVAALAEFLDDSGRTSVYARAGLSPRTTAGRTALVTRSGTCIRQAGDGVTAMAASDVAITVPGTNNLQLSVLGVPHLVVLPLQHGEWVPIGGPLGLISPRLPVFRPVKRWIVKRLNDRMPFVAFPNVLASAPIVPELRGELSALDIARAAIDLLHDSEGRQMTSARLREVAGPFGAANRLAAAIDGHARRSAG